MASMFRSLCERITTTFHQLRSPATSSSPSSGYVRMVDELDKLRRRMVRIRALLIDAEEREIGESRIKLWLEELRDVALDAEDAVEEFEYEVLRDKLESEEEQHDSVRDEDRHIIKRQRRVSDSDIPPPCTPLHDALFQEKILAEIQRINDRFQEIYEDAQVLGLHQEVGKRCCRDIDVFKPPQTSSSLVNEEEVRGRDVDEGKLIQMLLSDSAESVCVVSIVGMGGLGKTTLAQLVYNANQVKEQFQTRVWVCVSEPFDVTKLTREISQAVGGDSGPSVSEMTNFDYLQQILIKKLQGKRFLLVLDDVWNEKPEQWEALWVCLSKGANGSRVLITTRSEKVSRVCRVSEPNMHKPGCLSHEDSWSLFEKRAFGGRNSKNYPNLVRIGRQIVEKCEGLPLALKTLSGLLFDDLTEDTWEDVLKSELWKLPEGDILPALKLSYHHLPSPIKPCFAYCAVFPKDHEFDKDELVFMWMAQSYLQPNGERCMEDVGRAYFEELLQRCFFQTSESGDFVMHDMIHDLALSIWGTEECCNASDKKIASGKARHLLIDSKEDVEAFLSVEASKLKRVRTVYVSIWWYPRDAAKTQKATAHICSNMKYLRVLHLPDMDIYELPGSVGNLKHLRYLCIFATEFRPRLFESFGTLLNLQTLQIRGCGPSGEIPQQFTRLINLRHLVYDEESVSGQKMPRGIGRLTQLQTLPTLLFGAEQSGTGAGIEDLSRLNNLRGELGIVFKSLGSSMQHNDGGVNCILRNKKGLHTLKLDWNQLTCQEQDELIDNLHPHTNIRELNICGRLPKWLGDPSYERLQVLVLRCGPSLGDLSRLGQLPLLKRLEVWGENAEGELFGDGMFVHEASFFPSLEVLRLHDQFYCESIGREEKGAFPCLKELQIQNCHRLRYLKLRQLVALRTLHIRNCCRLITLDLCVPVTSRGESSELQQPPQGAVVDDYYCHIPNIRTMHLSSCPRLDILPAQQQRLFPFLRKLSVYGCPLLNPDKLGSVTILQSGRRLILRNVVDVDEASECKKELTGCKKLELRWDLEHESISSSAEEAEQVLDRLIRCTGRLKDLVVRGYRGRSFSHWMGGFGGFLCDLVKMTLSDCVHCKHLPPLGLLPSLEKLYISNMGEVTHVGPEFWDYEDVGSSVRRFHGGFPSLRTLKFYDMPKWEEWQWVQEDFGPFPKLQLLRICNCPKLKPFTITAALQAKLESGTFCVDGHICCKLQTLWPPHKPEISFWYHFTLQHYLVAQTQTKNTKTLILESKYGDVISSI